jgi:hypothetical protein
MENDIKYNLLSLENDVIGYFLNGKYFSTKFKDIGHEAELREDGLVYDNNTETPTGSVVGLSYIRLSDNITFTLEPSV